MRSTQANGNPVNLLSVSPYSYQMENQYSTWSTSRFFRAHISYSAMQSMIAQYKASAGPCPPNGNSRSCYIPLTSNLPEDWGIILVTGLVEAFPTAAPQCIRNTANNGCNDISMGVTMTEIHSYEVENSLLANAQAQLSKEIKPLIVTPARSQETPEYKSCFETNSCLGN